MNNKGFTLVELLVSLTIVAIITIIVTFSIGSTLSISKDNSYEILKKNIINMANVYVMECESNSINCDEDYVWQNNKTSFLANKLLQKGYFKPEELINPINEKDISDCLLINVSVNENKVYTLSINDSQC